VMPDLIRDVGGGTLAQAAIWGGILSTTFAVMQFLFGPVVGGLSDRYGRRPVLLVALIVMALDYVLMALAGALWVLLIGRVIGGITAATQSTASAYMADISAPHERAARFGLVGAAFGAGFVLGPLLGGLLAEYGTRAPFWLAAVLAASNALFGWIVLKETVTDETRRAFSWRRANPLGAFRALGRLPGIQLVARNCGSIAGVIRRDHGPDPRRPYPPDPDSTGRARDSHSGPYLQHHNTWRDRADDLWHMGFDPDATGSHGRDHTAGPPRDHVRDDDITAGDDLCFCAIHRWRCAGLSARCAVPAGRIPECCRLSRPAYLDAARNMTRRCIQ